MNNYFFLRTTLCCLKDLANFDTGLEEGNDLIDSIFLFGNCSEICSFNCLWFLKPLNTHTAMNDTEKHTLNNFRFRDKSR